MRPIFLIVAALVGGCGAPAPAPQGNDPADAVPAPNAPPQIEQPPGSAAPRAGSAPPRNAAGISACGLQDEAALPPVSLRALGTEPFWAARIDGRCIIYSHPDDQAGTRIWTRFTGSAESGAWTGFYDKQRFELRTRPQPGCSDGMSDRRYPLAVDLLVAGEERSGCAWPL